MQRTLVHLSDTHVLPTRDERLQGIDTLQNVRDALHAITSSGLRPDALIVSGDLANHGEPESYRRLRSTLDEAVAALGTELIVGIGNHDARPAFRQMMLDLAATEEPVDYVRWIGDLRIIVMDSTVPGAAYGEVRADQLTWLDEQLSTPADEGSILVLHHPPVPDVTPLAGLLTLHGAADLEQVVEGSDVLAVLAGHAHHAISAPFGGVFCYAAPATAYTVDPLLLEQCTLRGVQGAGFGLIRIVDGRAAALTIALPGSGEQTYRHDLSSDVVRRLTGLAPSAA